MVASEKERIRWKDQAEKLLGDFFFTERHLFGHQGTLFSQLKNLQSRVSNVKCLSQVVVKGLGDGGDV